MSASLSDSTALSIKEAALESGVSAHTMRYYERIGLLPAVDRDVNGQRRYGPRDLGAISILSRLRATGMPIQGMKRFAALLVLGDAVMGERRAMLEAHGQSVRERIRELETNLSAIDAKIALYLDHENERERSRPNPLARENTRAIAQEV